MIKPRRRKPSVVLSKTASASASVADAYLKYSTSVAHRVTQHLPLLHGWGLEIANIVRPKLNAYTGAGPLWLNRGVPGGWGIETGEIDRGWGMPVLCVFAKADDAANEV